MTSLDSGTVSTLPPDSGVLVDTGAMTQPADSGVGADAGMSSPADAAMMPPPDAGVALPEGAHIWSRSFGGQSSDGVTKMVKDAQGNIYMTGTFIENIDFGGGELTGNGMTDIFLTSLNPDGSHRWSKRLGGTGRDQDVDIDIDSTGNVYLSGFFEDTASFGGDSFVSAGFFDIFVASFAANGDHLWSARFGGAGMDHYSHISAAPDGTLLLGGVFSGTVDFGGGPITSQGRQDIFLARFTSEGVHISSQNFGDDGLEFLESIETDADGNIYISGAFRGGLDFGMHVLTSTVRSSAYIASFTPAIESRWAFGIDALLAIDGTVLDNDANVYLYGSFRETIDFGGSAVNSTGGADGFIASYNSMGTYRWERTFGGEFNDGVTGVHFDAQNDVYFTGYAHKSITFESGTFTTDGDFDAFFARYNTVGDEIWAKLVLSPGEDSGQAVWVDPDGQSLFGGSFEDTINFGGMTLTSTANLDGFLLTLTP